MARASELLKVAQSWLGKNEADGSFKEIIDVYNGHKPLARSYAVKYTDEWCATFITALAIKCNAVDIIPKECSCQKQIELFKKIGCFKEDESVTPEAGWILYYDWSDDGKGDNKGWADHVGIVEKVANGKITVIEGNYKASVKRREISVNGKYIRGYGVPKYDAEIVVKTLEGYAKDVIAGLHGTGHANRELSLKNAGCPYEYEKVRAKVNELMAAPSASKYYKQYTGKSSSIDTVFKEIGVPSQYIGNWAKRKPIAQANAIKNYTGTHGQNVSLIDLAKRGVLKKV